MRAPASRNWATRDRANGRGPWFASQVRVNPLLVNEDLGLPEGFVSLDDYLSTDCADEETQAKLQSARRRIVGDLGGKISKLAVLRLKSGFSQKELADAIQTSQPLLSGWETGKSKPSYENILKMCEKLGVDCNTLFEALRGQ